MCRQLDWLTLKCMLSVLWFEKKSDLSKGTNGCDNLKYLVKILQILSWKIFRKMFLEHEEIVFLPAIL